MDLVVFVGLLLIPVLVSISVLKNKVWVTKSTYKQLKELSEEFKTILSQAGCVIRTDSVNAGFLPFTYVGISFASGPFDGHTIREVGGNRLALSADKIYIRAYRDGWKMESEFTDVEAAKLFLEKICTK